MIETKEQSDSYKENYQGVKEQITCFFREVREIIDREEEMCQNKIT